MLQGHPDADCDSRASADLSLPSQMRPFVAREFFSSSSCWWREGSRELPSDDCVNTLHPGRHLSCSQWHELSAGMVPCLRRGAISRRCKPSRTQSVQIRSLVALHRPAREAAARPPSLSVKGAAPTASRPARHPPSPLCLRDVAPRALPPVLDRRWPPSRHARSSGIRPPRPGVCRR